MLFPLLSTNDAKSLLGFRITRARMSRGMERRLTPAWVRRRCRRSKTRGLGNRECVSVRVFEVGDFGSGLERSEAIIFGQAAAKPS